MNTYIKRTYSIAGYTQYSYKLILNGRIIELRWNNKYEYFCPSGIIIITRAGVTLKNIYDFDFSKEWDQYVEEIKYYLKFKKIKEIM